MCGCTALGLIWMGLPMVRPLSNSPRSWSRLTSVTPPRSSSSMTSSGHRTPIHPRGVVRSSSRNTFMAALQGPVHHDNPSTLSDQPVDAQTTNGFVRTTDTVRRRAADPLVGTCVHKSVRRRAHMSECAHVHESTGRLHWRRRPRRKPAAVSHD